jgi:hypothetical protein
MLRSSSTRAIVGMQGFQERAWIMTERPPSAPEFDAPALAKQLLRGVRAGALATLDREDGFPFASLVTVATDLDGSPLLLMSRLAATRSTSTRIRAPRSCSRRPARAIRSPIRGSP